MFLKIKLHPKSKKQKIEKIGENKYEVWVKAKAEQNHANNEMLDLLAEELKIERNKIRFYSGHHRPSKMVEILE